MGLLIMAKKPRTTSEHLISIYGYITGLKKDLTNLKENHLKHMHQDIDKVNGKVDRLLYVIIGGLAGAVLVLVELLK